MKVLSNVLGTFMMWIVVDRFACHIMNTHRRPPSIFMMWIVMGNVGVFSAIRIRKEKCKCQPIGNQESKNQPIGDKENKLFRMWNVNFECS
jgi:hypothetical protein